MDLKSSRWFLITQYKKIKLIYYIAIMATSVFEDIAKFQSEIGQWI